jgi:uncharacterized phage protein (TIGR01671 family)
MQYERKRVGINVEVASIRSGIGENMEDRYLFKAKHIHVLPNNNRLDGSWVVGFLSGERYIANDSGEYLIDPSTICQCTGLKDKNGKLIWENDVVKINNSKVNTLITFRDFEIICTIPNEKYYKHRLEYDTEYEVIGNIFDNPELLESEE